MEDLLAILIGIFYAIGVYHMLRHSIVKLIIGLIFLTHATNLLLFFSGGIGGEAPILEAGINAGAMADPLPQAFILTAIVISFGIIAFFIVLVFKTHEVSKTKDLDELKQEGL